MSYETIKGGLGARPIKDGITGVASGISNTMNTPIEILEMSFPVRVERYAILPDSGGAGRWRGGCGVERVWRILGGPSQVSLCCERTKSPPFGLAGGRRRRAHPHGRVGPDGVEREPNSKALHHPRRWLVALRAPGSGGYGPPRERDPARLRDDVINGYVSREAALATTATPAGAISRAPRATRLGAPVTDESRSPRARGPSVTLSRERAP